MVNFVVKGKRASKVFYSSMSISVYDALIILNILCCHGNGRFNTFVYTPHQNST